MTEQQHVWIVEYFERTEAGELSPDLVRTALAAQIDHDQKVNGGRYRVSQRVWCQSCTGKPGTEPGTVAVQYVGPGGEQFIYLPGRRTSGGRESKPHQVDPQAHKLFDLCTGVDVTQCRRCLNYYVLTGVLNTCRPGVDVVMIKVEESTYGAVSDTAAPSVTHKVSNVGPIRARVEASADN